MAPNARGQTRKQDAEEHEGGRRRSGLLTSQYREFLFTLGRRFRTAAADGGARGI